MRAVLLQGTDNFVVNDADAAVTVHAPAQTQRSIIGGGPHRIWISYRTEGVEAANAETRFFIYNSTLSTLQEVLRAPLPASQKEFAATITPPPELSGNVFRWMILYSVAARLAWVCALCGSISPGQLGPSGDAPGSRYCVISSG